MEDEDAAMIRLCGPNGSLSIEWNDDAIDLKDDFAMSMHLVSIDVGFMQASKRVYMHDDHFAEFLKSLIPLHQRLNGKASHETLEGDLTIEVEYSGGHVTISGELIEYYSLSKACYIIETDQSYMSAVIDKAKRLSR